MLYEVSADALDSLTGATTVSVFSFTRPYQYVIAFNQQSPALRSPTVRRALNAAIDRAALVRDGLDGRGAPSSGPIWPQHWALHSRSPTVRVRSAGCCEELTRGANRQRRPRMAQRSASSVWFPLTTNGLDCWSSGSLKWSASRWKLRRHRPTACFRLSSDCVLRGGVSRHGQRAESLQDLSVVALGWLFQPWRAWRRFDSMQRSIEFVTPVRTMSTARAVAGFQRAVVDNPPGIFLAWSERARAVNRRFDVPAEPGRDILTTLRLWRPANDLQSRRPKLKYRAYEPEDSQNFGSLRAAARGGGRRAPPRLRLHLPHVARARHAADGRPGQPERRHPRRRGNPPLRRHQCRPAESAVGRSAGHRALAVAAGPHPEKLRPAGSRVPRDHAVRRIGQHDRDKSHRQTASRDSGPRTSWP